MNLPLEAISPVDGRYSKASKDLVAYFSEYALFKYRVRMEIEYLIRLSQFELPQLPQFTGEQIEKLKDVYRYFGVEDAKVIKEIELTTNHDIKAVEYFVKEKLQVLGLGAYVEWVHFGLTSQDINNTAIPLLLKEANEAIIFPAIQELIDVLSALSSDWKSIPMLARTHGQPASPTSLGKEILVFVERLEIQLQSLKSSVWAAKFGGATGGFNAHKVAFPNTDWPAFANAFMDDLGLYRSRTTTQIEHYDHLATYCQNLMRIHTILIDLSRDVWTYISMEYFKQKVKEGETGSSAMPHKVNPIDFENAEGNLGLANAILDHFAQKLPISRLQRDLTDSTVLRNLGVPLAHGLISYKSLQRGLGKLLLNSEAIEADLNKHAAVVAEAIQTILRREGYPKPYEALKDLTRGKSALTMEDIQAFVQTLDVNDSIKAELMAICPENYTGFSF
jgi:adenylosuccinate lyase